MSYYAFEGLIPVVHPTAFVHPSAVLIGDVIVGAGVYIGPLASLRGDYGRLTCKREPIFRMVALCMATATLTPSLGKTAISGTEQSCMVV
ncbi:hypothetical protein EsCd1HHP049_00048 [Escherichia sp. HH154_1D]|nr:hypothetical protein EsCdI10290_00044 [Escherichia sp. 10290]BDI44593.1 hypothetical protein EsCd1HHP049_00048 [Escherichia sp. HH154_1D]